jgi:hypothetical protein
LILVSFSSSGEIIFFGKGNPEELRLLWVPLVGEAFATEEEIEFLDYYPRKFYEVFSNFLFLDSRSAFLFFFTIEDV